MTLLGFVPINEDKSPYRAPRSGYGFHTQAQKGYHPPRIYQERKTAEKQSPVSKALEVFINDKEEY